MKKNVGTIDRWIRGIVGALLVVLGGWAWSGWQGSTLGIIALIIGAVLLVTALVGVCPLYRLLGVSTCKGQGC